MVKLEGRVFLNIDEVADKYRVSNSTVRRRIKQGKIKEAKRRKVNNCEYLIPAEEAEKCFGMENAE